MTRLAQSYGLSYLNVKDEFYERDDHPFTNELIGLVGSELNEEEMIHFLEEILLLCENDYEYDFEDMIWLPLILDLEIQCYDWILIDEAQDLNPCQIKLLEKVR